MDLGYGSFNPKDPNAWAQFKQDGAVATTGINAMPHVLGGWVPYTWMGRQDRTPTEIQNWLYPSAQGGGGGGGGVSPSTLQQLLGLAGGGATAGMLAGGGGAGDEDVSQFGLKGPRNLTV